MIELKELRDKKRLTSKTFDMLNGYRRCIVGKDISMYVDDSGEILDVDLTPEAVQISGVNAWAFRKQRLPVVIAVDGRRRVYPTRKIDTYLHFGGVVPINSGAVYNYSLTGSTVSTQQEKFRIEYIASDRGLKFMIHCDADAPTRWEMPISFQGCELVGRNLVVNGDVVARVPLITYWDDDTPLMIKTADHLIQNGKLYFEVTPTAGKAFVIDPEVVIQPSDSGSYWLTSDAAYHAVPYASTPYDQISVRQASGSDRRTIFRLDWSSVPAGSTITSATLAIWRWNDGAASTMVLCPVINTGFVHEDVCWDEKSSGVAWNSGGCGGLETDYTVTNQASTAHSGIDTPIVWDITAQLQALDEGRSWEGLWIYSAGATEYPARSYKYTTDPTKRPSWTIDYRDASGRVLQQPYYY